MNYTTIVAVREFVIAFTILTGLYILIRKYNWKLFGRFRLDKPIWSGIILFVLLFWLAIRVALANTDAYRFATKHVSTHQPILNQTGEIKRIEMIKDNFYVPRRPSAIEAKSEGAKAMYNLCIHGEKNDLSVKVSLNQEYETGIWSINELKITN